MLVLAVVLFGSFVSAEMLVSEVGVEYDNEIEEYFNSQALVEELISQRPGSQANSLEIINNEIYVKVLIYLKDSSEADDLLLIFSENEIKNMVHRDSSLSISVKITKEGFDKLVQDKRVDRVYYNFPVRAFEEKEPLDFIRLVVYLAILLLFILIFYAIIKKIIKKNG